MSVTHLRWPPAPPVTPTCTGWPKKMYTHLQQFGGFDSVWMPMVATSTVFGCRWWPLRQCLDADGGHFEHLHWIQNSRTSLISFLLLYKYSSYDYRVIFFMSKYVYIFLGHSVLDHSNFTPWRADLRNLLVMPCIPPSHTNDSPGTPTPKPSTLCPLSHSDVQDFRSLRRT